MTPRPPNPPIEGTSREPAQLRKANLLIGVGVGLVLFGFATLAGAPVLNLLLFPLAVVLIGAGAALIAVGFSIRQRVELAQWRALCAQDGWTFQQTDRDLRPRLWVGAPPFGAGTGQRALNVVTGLQDGLPFEAWTYQYTIQNGKSSTTVNHRCFVLEMPATMPGLAIQGEHVGHRLMDALTGEDIDFESAEFSQRFRVTCYDRRRAYDVLHAQAQGFLMQVGTSFTWQWRGRRLLVCEPGVMRREEVLHLWPLARTFRSLVPRHLLHGHPTAVAP